MAPAVSRRLPDQDTRPALITFTTTRPCLGDGRRIDITLIRQADKQMAVTLQDPAGAPWGRGGRKRPRGLVSSYLGFPFHCQVSALGIEDRMSLSP
jgi:hypothetical protein